MRKVMAILAHPDDEVLGCGGTLAKMADHGDQVLLLICGEGLTARTNIKVDELRALDDDLQNAAKILGATDVFHLDWPDNSFDSRELLTLIRAIEEIALPFAPEVVFTHHGGDLNIDHRYVHQAVMSCFRPLPARPRPLLLAVEVASSTGWAAPTPDRVFQPNFFSEVTETLERKIQAMTAYRTEAQVWPHPRSPEAIRAWAQRWGSLVGVAAAEPFMVLRGFLT